MAINVNFGKIFKSLCTPAKIYLLMNAIFIFFNILQNLTSDSYCLGFYRCEYNTSKWPIFLGQFAYVALWTYILNAICNKGYTNISWLLLLLPFILLFIILATLLIEGGFKKLPFIN